MYPELKSQPKVTLERWREEGSFDKTISEREGCEAYVFYEGPPSANGKPGIHHVMARTIKDAICRYQTLKGKQVHRKAGWDTHGLPVELGVEKEMGLTKEDIGQKVSVAEFNKECRQSVMRYKAVWEDLTSQMGYWVDMEAPYVTYESKYMESVWWALKTLHEKGKLYKGYTIQPYSPKAGTGLSSHELNQPGCYRDVKDTSVVAGMKLTEGALETLQIKGDVPTYLLAWTTTPWTLPSNTGLVVGPEMTYLLVETVNRYTDQRQKVLLAESAMTRYFSEHGLDADFDNYDKRKFLPYRVLASFKGRDLEGLRYEPLFSYEDPGGDPYRVVSDGFVTADSGTGVVHCAPAHGADDARVGKERNLGQLILVDEQGRFRSSVIDFAGEYVKDAYKDEESDGVLPIDVRICNLLKERGQAFLVEKYEHSYPHCWRTDKPIIYYPLDSWFIKTTDYKDRLIELNKTIGWHPESTGTGRFGNWLENLVDWNLSRSRYWGVPLPVWSNGEERKVIGSIAELKEEVDRAVAAGHMDRNPFSGFVPGDMSDENYRAVDLHRPVVDEVVLVSDTGAPMHRESDIIDVWFDSGAMPFSQLHYPFENKDLFASRFPADFIAEGVDQTRGWFFTLHALGVMLFDSVAFKNVISNGLVLDKNGQKMSKRLGNSVDPFEALDTYGPDALRWYMLTNANPWDNLKFDPDGVSEVKRKFFSTLENTFSFFRMYANIDEYRSDGKVEASNCTELDRWILSELHSLIGLVTSCYEQYDLTGAARAINEFTLEHLSNWYVRLSRRRFWKGEFGPDKKAAYDTLHLCLETVAILASPVAPFFTDELYRALNGGSGLVHTAKLPQADETKIDQALEQRMAAAQKICSLGLSLREREKIKVRQPLRRIMVPVASDDMKGQIQKVAPIICSELNVKSVDLLPADDDQFVRLIKANFKTLGPKFGKKMKPLAQRIGSLSQAEIQTLEQEGVLMLQVDGDSLEITSEDVDIAFAEKEGTSIASSGGFTVSLDITMDEELKLEGLAREVIKRIQNIRKDEGLEVTDRIALTLSDEPTIKKAVDRHSSHICQETLALGLQFKKAHELSGTNHKVEGHDLIIQVKRAP